jgi:hypothetical protein
LDFCFDVHLITTRIKHSNALFAHTYDFTESDDQGGRRTLADTAVRRFNIKDLSVGTSRHWCRNQKSEYGEQHSEEVARPPPRRASVDPTDQHSV